jgi:hypothetical protein
VEHNLEDQQESHPFKDEEAQQSAHNTIDILRDVAMRKMMERD